MSLFSNISKLSTTIGAEINDFDLKNVSKDDVQEFRAILSEHKVLFFPNQVLTIEEHVAFGELFGEL